LFSSSPATFAAIDGELARGHALADAIERIAFPDQHSNTPERI
jgi:conjugal transfer ATP-binding protein TraC